MPIRVSRVDRCGVDYIHTYIYIYTCIYTYIYIYTYTVERKIWFRSCRAAQWCQKDSR